MIPIIHSPQVAAAKSAGQPLVALESTIITHGMPYPQNLETARAVEQDIRDAGATPATIAVLEGHLHVGLSDNTLADLARRADALKLSRADLAVALATGKTGATTVAATMIAARLAGIEVFATGGIGGVHPGAELDFDISADLMELAQTPVTVVAAGPKAILDVPKTLEILETQGVPVIAYGQDSLPAFWSRTCDISAPLRLDTAQDIAASHLTRARIGVPGGQLVANPIPADAEIPAADLAPVIARAQDEAKAQHITGKALTPFLLDRIFHLTKGRSLTANIALVRNNARLAAEIATQIAGQRAIAGPAAHA